MKKIILSCFAFAIILSCKKEKVVGPAGADGTNGSNGINGTIPTGTIIGKTIQYDQNGNTYSVSLNTTTVSVDGTTNTAITDATGSYTLTNVGAGIYDISFQKPECGLSKIQGISFAGNGILRFNQNQIVKISDKATFTITSCTLKDTITPGFLFYKINATYPLILNNKRLVIFFSKTSSIDPYNTASFDTFINLIIGNNSTSYSFYFNLIQFNNRTNFPSGSIIYAKVYPNNMQSSGYYDYSAEKNVLTGVGIPFPTTFTLTAP
jgi:hypothetical protein